MAKELVLKQDKLALLSDKQLLVLINRKMHNLSNDRGLNLDLDKIYYLSQQVFYQIRGFGVLENLLKDDQISEVMINDIDNIFIEKKGQLKRVNLKIESQDEYTRIIQKIVSQSGREINLSNPIVDAKLEDGSRVNIVLPPISKNQPVMTIRKFPKKHIDMDFLIATGTITKEAALFLENLVKLKFGILIGGGTSSGKTTFLNALSEYIGREERIVTIEDSRELQLINKENLISLQSRNANTANKGRIEISDLIKNALRMRPDRIIVGEVRSSEAIDMLTALNTGHEGGLTTAHANSCLDMISRLETMVLRADANIPLEVVKRMIGSSLDILVHLSRLEKAKRRVLEISEVYFDDSQVSLNPIYTFDYKKDKLVATGNKLRHEKGKLLDEY